MLKQTAESSDRNRVLHLGDDKSLVDLGTFNGLMHGHKGGSLDLSFSWDGAKQFTFSASVTEADSVTSVSRFAYAFDEYRFGMVAGKTRADGYRLEVRGELNIPGVTVCEGLPAPIKCYGFPPEAVRPYQNPDYLPALALEFERCFERLVYLGPLRQRARRNYGWAGSPPLDVGWDGEQTIQSLVAAKVVSSSNSSVESRVAEQMKAMGLIDSFRLRPIGRTGEYEVLAKVTQTSTEVSLTDVGFGVSQVLPVLVLCYYVPEGTTVILEQPEIHLHPSAQSELADVLINVVKNRKLQIIVESHSEHLLRRLQRRIAEGKFPATDAALYFCEMQNGASRATELQVGDDGFIKNWPNDFFGDEMGEVAAIAEAGIKHRRSRTG